MRKIGLGMCWNDLTAGEEFRTIGRMITETDLINFINTTGMVEVLFTDATAKAIARLTEPGRLQHL